MDDTLDLVTLSWCLGEIRESLAQTEAYLERQLQAEAGDHSLLRLARASLHQAHGALQIVEVPGVAVLTEEAESVLDAVERDQLALGADLVSRLSNAFRAVVEHLEDLLQGQPHQPLHLFPYLKALLEARSADRVHPADLFFPDLTRRLPVVVEQRAGAASSDELSEAKHSFEKGLLRFLREPDNSRGVEYMLSAVGIVERSPQAAANRNFWRVALAFFDALRSGALKPDVYAKRLLARLNLQLRKTIDEGAPVADRLFKDTLFSLAGAQGGSSVVTEVRRVYGLDGMVPPDYQSPRYGRHDARTVKAARDALVQLKVGWDKYMRGNSATDLVSVGSALDAFRAAVDRLPGMGMRELASALVEVRKRAAQSEDALDDAVGLEVATAILCAEQILEQGGRAGDELDPKAGEMAARLREVSADRAVAARELPDWLQDLSRKAQERMTMSVFITESQSNLRTVEKELDAFFRDPTQRAGLPETLRQLQQVSGALRLLGHADVSDAAAAVAGQVAAFIERVESPSAEECERVASSLGAIGFFVEGLQQPERLGGHFDFDRQTGEFRARMGESQRPRAGGAEDAAVGGDGQAVPAEEAGPPTGSIESALSNHTSAAEGLLASLQQAPDDPVLRGQLRDALARVRDDAVLLDDSELRRQAVDAIGLLDDHHGAPIEQLSVALAGLAGPTPEPAAAPVEAPTDEAAIDTELLEIFLAEAAEVLDAIGDSLVASRRAPSDQQFLTTIRRGFHTLKGSSRMVGLASFGDAGWAMEQVLNQWLADERTGSDDLFGLIDAARDVMSDWVAALEANPRARIDPHALVAAADALRSGGTPVLPPREAASPMGAPPAVDEPSPIESAPAIEESVFIEAPAAGPASPSPDDVPVLDDIPVLDDVPALDDIPALDDVIAAAGEPESVASGMADALLPIEVPVPEVPVLDVPAFDNPVPELSVAQVPAVESPALDLFGDVVADAESVAAPLPDGTRDLPVSDGADEVSAETGSLFAGDPVFGGDSMFAEPPATADRPLFDGEPLFERAPPDTLPTPAAATADVESTLAEFNEDIDAVIARFVADDRAEAGQAAAESGSPADVARVPEPSVPAVAPVAAAADAPAHEPATPAFVPAASDDVVQIGHLSVSRPLYMIFLGEADELIETLVRDCDDWRQTPARDASEAALRAVHSLAGSASVVGLTGVQAIAERLETVYQTQANSGQPMSESDLRVLTQAVERTRAMLHRFAGGAVPRDEPDTLVAVTALAERLQSAALAAMSERHTTAPVEPAGTQADAHDEAVRDDVQAVTAADELDPELLPLFVEEADELLPAIGEDLRRWLQAPADSSLAQRLMRAAHTVKGSARMAGAMALGQRVHEMETRIESLALLPTVPRELIEDLIAAHDQVAAMFETFRRPEPGVASPPAAAAVAQTPAVAPERLANAGAAGESPAEAPTAVPVAAAPAAPVIAMSPTPPVVAGGPGPVKPASAGQLVRVRAELLDRLVNEAGEVSIARSKLDNELSGLRLSLADLTENVNRLRAQLRELEIQAETTISARIQQSKEHERNFDPLEFDRYTRFQELTRMMAESVNDVATVQQNATRNLDEAVQDLLRQGQVLRELQQNLMRVRMVQFGSISDRMFRVVRQAAKDVGKRVNLDLRGAGVEVDRGVLERMAGPIEHLLRNAVAHGIEPVAARQAAGKPDTGEIRVEVRQEGNEIGLTFSDDGAGLDIARIRARGESAGLIAAGSQLSDREIAELIFAPGFSTADRVTEVSGRGVGLDVVRAETVALGGRIETESTPGSGTRFIVRLPLTLAIAQVVLVGAGEHRYAVPSSSVEQVLQVKAQALADAYGQGHVEWQGAKVPLFYLGALVDMPDVGPAAQQYSPIVILRSGNQRIALHVDGVTRNQEVVVKNVGPQVAQVRGVSGATVMGNGDIVLIVNPVLLAQTAAGSAIDLMSLASGSRGATRLAVPTSVMVVDDSLTVRKATQRLLTREGYQVTLAKDGVDALRQLQDAVPDILLVDIEMPRMDGFDLTRNLRADERYRHVPIVMITSRTADKHRDYALSLGVDAFMGKPFAEDELLATIAGFVARARPALAVG